MIALLKEWAKWKVVARWRQNRFPSNYTSHSELGEDMMIRGILHHMGLPWNYRGFYIDVGAHHPASNSNTWHFYQRGWWGINVDATPGSMESFRVLRPRDVNLECCVVPKETGPEAFYCFENPLLNTLDAEQAAAIQVSGRSRLLRKAEVPCATLNALLAAHAPMDRRVELLSIDIEGVDEQVLRTLDWAVWRPRVVVFERHEVRLEALGGDALVAFLVDQGYDVAGACRYSVIMADRQQWAGV